MVLLQSQNKVNLSCLHLNNHCNQIISFAPLDRAMYLASIVKRATNCCTLETQLMVAPTNVKT